MKFGNELTMELDQLDRVSGGTYHEYRELSDFMYDVKNCGKWKKHRNRQNIVCPDRHEKSSPKAALDGVIIIQLAEPHSTEDIFLKQRRLLANLPGTCS